ncbi:Serine/threonine-protein kinase [Ceratobasidium sp. AG-Ba]|nr:Serine/threonine-protein kinase [Ceratobasidium sp. AG-Ba]
MHHRISQFIRGWTGTLPSEDRSALTNGEPPVDNAPPRNSAVFSVATAHALPFLHPNTVASTGTSAGNTSSAVEIANALLPLSAQCALSLASVVAELAPIPYIGAVASCLTFVFQAVEKSRVNKEQWKLLQGRCVMVVRIAGSQVKNGGGEHYPGLAEATEHLTSTITRIGQRANTWNNENVFLALVQSDGISQEIKDLFAELDSCLTMFSFATDVTLNQWIGEFNAVQTQELAKLEELRSLMESTGMRLDVMNQNQETVLEITKRNNELLERVVNQNHEILQNPNETVAVYSDAAKIVQIIRTVTDIQLPPDLLVGRQCDLDDPLPIRSGHTCDIYMGSFLTSQKVAKKVFRIGTSEKDGVDRYAQARASREF